MPFLAAWGIVFTAMFVCPSETTAPSTHVIVFVIFAGFCCFGVAQTSHMMGFVSNSSVERTFVLLSVWDKSLLAVCCAFGLLST